MISKGVAFGRTTHSNYQTNGGGGGGGNKQTSMQPRNSISMMGKQKTTLADGRNSSLVRKFEIKRKFLF